MARRTQGSAMWMVVPTTSDPEKFELIKIGAPKDHKPGTDTKEKLEITDLEEEYSKKYLDGGGLSDTGTATFSILADPKNPAHQRLFSMVASGESATFIQGWPGEKRGSVAHIVPEVAENGEITLSNQRTWTKYKAYVDSFPLDIDANTVVQTTVTLQRQSAPEWIWETAAPEPPVVVP